MRYFWGPSLEGLVTCCSLEGLVTCCSLEKLVTYCPLEGLVTCCLTSEDWAATRVKRDANRKDSSRPRCSVSNFSRLGGRMSVYSRSTDQRIHLTILEGCRTHNLLSNVGALRGHAREEGREREGRVGNSKK